MKKIAILFVLLLVATSVVYAQKVTYHYAKNIVNGVESQITPPKDIIFEFQGNDVFLYQINT